MRNTRFQYNSERDLTDRIGGHEGSYLLLVHEIDQVGELVGGEHHLDLHLPLVAVTAIDGMEREAAAHGVDDILLDLLVVVGDDEDARLLIDFLHEVVDDQTVEPCADQTHEHH